MSERGNFRGGGGGRGNRGDRGGRGGGEPGGRGGSQAQGGDRKKENILDLTKYMDKEIMVKFNGGREGEMGAAALSRNVCQANDWRLVTGMLKGYDQLMNLVLDNVKEVTRGECAWRKALRTHMLTMYR